MAKKHASYVKPDKTGLLFKLLDMQCVQKQSWHHAYNIHAKNVLLLVTYGQNIKNVNEMFQ